MTELAAFAAFAEELADAARAAVLSTAGEALGSVENKAEDGAFDPVTIADRAAERAMRDLVATRWGDHGVQGEEFGSTPSGGRYDWSLDPIDGTRAFICGLPTWTVLIALLDHGRPVLGVIDAPRLDERYVGFAEEATLTAGSGATRLRTSGCSSVGRARLSTTDPYLFSPQDRERFDRLRGRARLTRYGLDAYAYARLAAGGLDLVAESGLAPHDLNALLPVVVAAGGVVSDWNGNADFSRGELLAAASLQLHAEAVSILNG